MPRSGQIIPVYVHPHDEIYINDNTEYREYTSDASGLRYYCPFASSKGRDTLLKFKNWTAWCKEFGLPNYRLYGQSTYMPYTLLFNGNTEVWCQRVTAKDATYANLILTASYKTTASGKFNIKFDLHRRTGLRNLDDFETIVNALETTVPDADGYRRVPIMSFWSLGRGVYGTDFRVRISHDKGADKQNSYKNYNIDLLSTEDGNTLVENYNVTFYLDGIDPLTRVSNYVEEIVNHDEKGSTRIGMQFFYDNYVTLFEAYKENYYNGTPNTVSVEQVDRLPAVELPSTTSLYHLTADDGTKPAGGLYVYDGTNGVFLLSSFTTQSVDTLPDVGDASENIIYTLTSDDISSIPAKMAGSSWVIDNGSWIAAPAIVDVEKLPNTTLYTEGVVYELTAPDNGKIAGSKWIYDSATNDFIAYVESEETEVEDLEMDISTWDMFGYNRFTKTDDEFMEVEGGLSSVLLFDLEGVALLAGSDGSMGEDQPASVREAAIEEAMLEAFDGATDRMILSKRRTPIDILLDFNASLNLKKKMAAFSVNRGDHLCYLDCGFLQTTSDIRDIGDALRTINTYLVSKNSGMMYTYDPITGKAIPVTITLWLASAFPTHVRERGKQTPFAGEDYAVLSGYTNAKTVKPVYDEDLDADILEEFYDNYKINYLEALDERTIMRGTQITCQQKYSDLSKENNVLITLEIKRTIERLISKNRYHWTEPEDLKNFREDCETVFSSYKGTKCKSLDIDVQQNAWEKTRYITHVYLAVVFRTYQERGIVEIDINPRA